MEDLNMKKLIFTLAICFGILSARASFLPSSLTLRMWDYSLMSVVFDGQVYDQTNTSFTISNVSGGSHFLKVYRYFTNSHGMVNSFPKMVFSGYISLSPGKSITGMISGDCHFVVLSEYSIAPTGYHHGNGHHGNPHHGNNSGNNYSGYSNNNYNDYNSGFEGMSNYDFMNLKSLVASTSFDDTKLAICKQAVSANSVTSSQVSELMMLLTFESGKLDLAKFAYGNVVDKSRFYLVNNAFTFSSSIDELNRYIQSY